MLRQPRSWPKGRRKSSRKLKELELKEEEERLSLEEEVAQLENDSRASGVVTRTQEEALPQGQSPTAKRYQKKATPVVCSRQMYPMVRFGIGKVAKNEDGLTWNQTPDERFRIEVDPNKGVDPMNEQILEGFLSSVRNAPRSVRQSFLPQLVRLLGFGKLWCVQQNQGRGGLAGLGLQLGSDFRTAPYAQGRQRAMESTVKLARRDDWSRIRSLYDRLFKS